MARNDTKHYPSEAALVEFSSEGCLPFFALPPLTVIVVGFLMALFLTRIEFNDIQQEDIRLGGVSGIASLFTPEIHYWGEEINVWSATWGLDPNLVATVMQIESCGDPRAVSHAGAMGLFQVMPYHFTSGEDPYKPGVNATRGLSYLKQALEARGGDIRLALAGYNGGITGARRPESAWSAEMIRYVYWGTGIYTDARKGKTHSDRLEEWLARGGASLCAQAGGRLGIAR
ncbi:MAG: lytic transglycosylase domain-containing protein [Chloroflexi bacterium]|nr:lytic transglycosylase domain-containing protein [Chloroflexota bacterium]